MTLTKPRITATLVALLLCATTLTAAELRSSVIAVDANSEVQLSLQPGTTVNPGDEVRIEANVPGVGLLAISTRWQIVRVDPGQSIAVAAPQGEVTGTPQVGYSAVITTSEPAETAYTPKATAPAGARVTYETQPCDLVGGSPDDPDLVGIAPGVTYDDLDADAVIRECLAASRTWPDTARFHTQLTRGYFKAGQMENAYYAAITGVEKGSGHATALLGVLYMTGNYVQKDLGEALELFERAAEAGNPGGMLYAAGMYFNGTGTAPDAFAAARYYHMAAEIGNSHAYANLGFMYDTGQGVAWNPQEAAAYLLMALAMNSDLARTKLLEEFGTLTLETRIEIQDILSDSGNYSGMGDGADDPATHRALLAHIMH